MLILRSSKPRVMFMDAPLQNCAIQELPPGLVHEINGGWPENPARHGMSNPEPAAAPSTPPAKFGKNMAAEIGSIVSPRTASQNRKEFLIRMSLVSLPSRSWV